jgi:hypothetical protein
MDFAEATNPGSYAGMEGAYLSCEDMEFQAEWDEITVLPNFQGKKLAMICVRACASPCTLERCHARRCVSPGFRLKSQGEFGPFIPNVPVKVPLFIAMNLKEARRARIRAPAWLNSREHEAAPCHTRFLAADPRDARAEALSDVLDREREMADQASDLAEVGMPFHYNAIAHKLLELCVHADPPTHPWPGFRLTPSRFLQRGGGH